MTGFHEGELLVQRQAGVSDLAARLEPMLDPPDLDGGARLFLAQRELAILTARDAAGLLWVSPLVGPPGLLDGQGTTLRVTVVPAEGDPLHDLPAGQPVGLLAIDLVARRRVRVNGTLQSVHEGGLVIEVEQAYGNCPQHLHPHRFDEAAVGGAVPVRTGGLDATGAALVTAADTFFLGTTHPTRGSDASHRARSRGRRRSVVARLRRQTTCSTAWATSRSTTPPPCCSWTGTAAPPCSSADRRSSST